MIKKLTQLEQQRLQLLENLDSISKNMKETRNSEFKITEYPSIFYKFIAAGIFGLLSVIFFAAGVGIAVQASKLVMFGCGAGTLLAAQFPLVRASIQLIKDKKQWQQNKQNLIDKYSNDWQQTIDNIYETNFQIIKTKHEIKKSGTICKPKNLPLKSILDENDRESLEKQ